MTSKNALVSLAVGLSLFAPSPEVMAKTVNGAAGKTANEASVIGVAGPAPRKASAQPDRASQPSKKVLRKMKISPPPPMHDPN